MNLYVKSGLLGVFGYLFILIASFCAVVNKSSDFLLCVFSGPFMWIPLLVYPSILLAAIFTVLSISKKKISPSLISSSIIFFGIGMLLAQYKFDLFNKGMRAHQLLLIAVIGCSLGFLYVKLRSLVKINSFGSKSRTED